MEKRSRLRNAFLTVTSRSRLHLAPENGPPGKSARGSLPLLASTGTVFLTRRTRIARLDSTTSHVFPHDEIKIELNRSENEKYRYSLLRSFIPFRLVSRSHAPQRVHKSLVSIKETRNRGKIATLYNVHTHTHTHRYIYTRRVGFPLPTKMDN